MYLYIFMASSSFSTGAYFQAEGILFSFLFIYKHFLFTSLISYCTTSNKTTQPTCITCEFLAVLHQCHWCMYMVNMNTLHHSVYELFPFLCVFILKISNLSLFSLTHSLTHSLYLSVCLSGIFSVFLSFTLAYNLIFLFYNHDPSWFVRIMFLTCILLLLDKQNVCVCVCVHVCFHIAILCVFN